MCVQVEVAPRTVGFVSRRRIAKRQEKFVRHWGCVELHLRRHTVDLKMDDSKALENLLFAIRRCHSHLSGLNRTIDLSSNEERWILDKVGESFEPASLLGRQGRPSIVGVEVILFCPELLQMGECLGQLGYEASASTSLNGRPSGQKSSLSPRSQASRNPSAPRSQSGRSVCVI